MSCCEEKPLLSFYVKGLQNLIDNCNLAFIIISSFWLVHLNAMETMDPWQAFYILKASSEVMLFATGDNM